MASLGEPHKGSRSAISPPGAYPQPSLGTDTVEGGARAPAKLAGKRSARFSSGGSDSGGSDGASRVSPSALGPARPGPHQSPPPHRQGSPALRTSLQRLAPTGSSPRCQADRVRGAGCQPGHPGRPPPAPWSPTHAPPLAFRGPGPRSSASPSSPQLSFGGSSLGFPPLSPRSEWQRGVPPPTPLQQSRQGLRRMRQEQLAARVSGKGGGGIRRESARRPLPGPP
ncbi:basic salivary proline-rich protein 4-like [Cebus imitator]|uniref:basic salivary proline-rich protein 4-like n=1 Tax=Cebus imitator TaxID=2715852 RepID=UPI00189BCBFD|nr:basic salivary proline-rich protein 4-like [Cebus imitator]